MVFQNVLGTLGSSFLGNMLTGKRNIKAGYGNKQGKGILRAHHGSKIATHSSRNIETQNYYQEEPRFNGVYSRDNL